MSTCTHCQAEFTVPEEQKKFLETIKLPDPQKCPDCRRQGRFAFRNERKLYHRKCDLSGKQIISIYSPDKPNKVYNQHEWFGDKWDGMDYGRDFDFTRPFFEQYAELMQDTPKLSMFASQNENSDYANGAQQDKNCYMIFVSDHNEDCYYSYAIDSCTDCTDCLNCFKCTLCIENVDCSNSYNLAYCQNTHNSRDSMFLYDCRNCQDCFGCYGLRGKQFCIGNKQFTKEEYKKKIKELNAGSYQSLQKFKEMFKKQVENAPIHKYMDGSNNDNVTGDHLINSKNCIECYDSANLEDCGYLVFSFNSKDCWDGHVVVDKSELCYETISTISQYNTQFTFVGFYSKNSQYIDHCHSCDEVFACSGLKKKKYCIFNKQYTKEEYFKLKARIIEHMKKEGSWGQPFPISASPFGYNETVAQEFYPLTKEEALKRGYKWHDDDSHSASYQGPQIELPDDIANTPKDITEKILICASSQRPFKITSQELNLYQQRGLALPRKSFDERHAERLARRNPRQLWKRECAKCKKSIETSYAPERPETVYCETCYQHEVN